MTFPQITRLNLLNWFLQFSGDLRFAAFARQSPFRLGMAGSGGVKNGPSATREGEPGRRRGGDAQGSDQRAVARCLPAKV